MAEFTKVPETSRLPVVAPKAKKGAGSSHSFATIQRQLEANWDESLEMPQYSPVMANRAAANLLGVSTPQASSVATASVGAEGTMVQRACAECAEEQKADEEKSKIQTKLAIGQPGDKYEQEADEVARQVVDQIHASPSSDITNEAEATLQRQELPATTVAADITLMRQETGAATEASTDVEDRIQRSRGQGKPLGDAVQAPMEQAFGTDFSAVRIHTDGESDELNQAVQAKAFTTGQDIYFRSGAYEPGSRGGQELLAHELTHVVQQSPESTKLPTPERQNSLEKNINRKVDVGIRRQWIETDVTDFTEVQKLKNDLLVLQKSIEATESNALAQLVEHTSKIKSVEEVRKDFQLKAKGAYEEVKTRIKDIEQPHMDNAINAIQGAILAMMSAPIAALWTSSGLIAKILSTAALSQLIGGVKAIDDSKKPDISSIGAGISVEDLLSAALTTVQNFTDQMKKLNMLKAKVEEQNLLLEESDSITKEKLGKIRDKYLNESIGVALDEIMSLPIHGDFTAYENAAEHLKNQKKDDLKRAIVIQWISVIKPENRDLIDQYDSYLADLNIIDKQGNILGVDTEDWTSMRDEREIHLRAQVEAQVASLVGREVNWIGNKEVLCEYGKLITSQDFKDLKSGQAVTIIGFDRPTTKLPEARHAASDKVYKWAYRRRYRLHVKPTGYVFVRRPVVGPIY